MTKNETAGMRGTSQASRSMERRPSALHQVELVQVDVGPVAEDEQHDGQPHAYLGGGDGDDEEGEDLADHVVAEGAEGDEVDVHRIEHQLDGHQDEDRVLP